jgi:DAK2 domain fusion protein YloV
VTDAASLPGARQLIAAAAEALKARTDEVNRLNVFPVPDGDTGTNMSLTMDAVVAAVELLGATPSSADTCAAVTKGSLMGARGNSGVILSQILRGLCEVIAESSVVDATALSDALDRSVDVAFQAVRKPVEGTMLTVLKDTADAAREAAKGQTSLLDALEIASTAAFESVKHTPELLPVLKENGVVDAGGFGLAILLEGLVAAASGTEVRVADVSSAAAPLLAVAPVDDWNDAEYLYCTEFLLFGEDIEKPMLDQVVSAAGGSELVVGDRGAYKIHVHTNDPGAVLAEMTSLGEVAEVHINNMRRQQAERDAKLKAEHAELTTPGTPPKPIGVVAVATGSGLVDILKSLGADVIVNGGQTMNPSTKDIADAISRVNAESVVVLPNNKNIVMAASAAATVADRPVAVVPTHSVPEAFSALLALEPEETDLQASAAAMGAAASRVRTGEVTTAVKRASYKAGKIRAGQVIGIANDEIEVVGDSVFNVTLELSDALVTPDCEMLTVLAGVDLTDTDLQSLTAQLQDRHPDIGVEAHRGEQPLYPVLMAAE